MLELTKMEKETKIELCQIEASRPAAVTSASTDKKYVPRLPAPNIENSLPVLLGRFNDSIKAAQISPARCGGRQHETPRRHTQRSSKHFYNYKYHKPTP